MSDSRLGTALDEAARPLRGLSGLARLLPAVAAVVALAALAAWLVRAGVVGGPALVLAIWVAVALTLLVGVVAARRAIRALGPWHVAALLEGVGAWRRGALTTVLDGAAEGTSPALHAAADGARADEIRSRAAAALAPAVAAAGARARLATVAIAIAAAALVLAQPLRGAASRLWQPITAWRALTAPVGLRALETEVDRGTPAVLALEAIGQQRAVLLLRSPGEAWRRETVLLDADGRATFTTPPLGAPLVARLEAGGRRSGEVEVAVRLPAFLGALAVTAEYPDYLGLAPEPLALTGDTLALPEGTVLRIQGRATSAIASARFESALGDVPLTVAEAAFSGVIRPRTSASYTLRVAPRGGGALEGEPPMFSVRVVADSAPDVVVPVPGVDTVAPPSLRLPVVIAAGDDHGLRSAGVELRRAPGAAVQRLELPLPAGTTDRALLTTTLDLVALGLEPGDTLRYVAVATDNAPSAQRGRSREYLVRIPTAGEQRDAQRAETARTAAGLDSLVAQARAAQRQTEDLARERARAPGSGTGETDPLALETARRAEAAAQGQERVMADAAQMQAQVEALRQAAERDGLADSTLAARLGEIRQLLDQAISPEMRAQLEQLREALANLDANATRDALQSLAAQQQRSRDALEQAREIFKRAALETSLATMAEEAKQLAQAQRDVTSQLGGRDSAAAAKAERALAARADSLANALERTAAKLPTPEAKAGVQDAAAQARAAQAQMQQAADAAAAGKRGEAQQQGRQAEGTLQQLDQQIREERQQMQAQMREETVRALDRALAETARLAERQVVAADAFRRGMPVAALRAEQALLAEGAGKLVEQVVAAGATNALVSTQIGASLAAARQAMRGAIEAVASATPNYRSAAELSGEAVDALAVAAFALLRSRDQVNGSESGSGVQEMMEQMQQMAGKQGQLNQSAQGMMQQGEGSAQEMMRLAMQQRALAQQLERMRSQGQMPGAGAMAQEAKEVARALEAGRLDRETVQRQDRLFRKMLDAGRSLQGEEQDETKERQGTSATPGALRRPDALDPRLRSGADDIRLPGWEALQRLTPDARRRVIEYFRLLSGGTP